MIFDQNNKLRRINAGFTPLEKIADFSRRLLPFKADGILMPLSAQNARKRSSPAGFTFIEVMLVVAIFSIISMAAFSLIMDYYRTSDLISVQMVLQGEGRSAINQMVNDMRRVNQGSTGASAIESASAASFIFYSNIDADSYFEKVEYAVAGTELRKSVTKPDGNPLAYNPANKVTTVLTSKIANGAAPVFSYYDNSYAGTGAPLVLAGDFSIIRFVKINLILDDHPAAPTASLNMEASVALRNLKDN